jgi:hypothetical protein
MKVLQLFEGVSDMKKCSKCKSESENSLIETDEFGKLKESVYYCESCFIEKVNERVGNFKPETCTQCNAELIPVINEDIFDEGIVFYRCPNQNEEMSHDEYGEYIIQPKGESYF